ncbi:hypothetical protein BH11ARM1_BH11ARM1_14590 [soil metagenome]
MTRPSDSEATLIFSNTVLGGLVMIAMCALMPDKGVEKTQSFYALNGVIGSICFLIFTLASLKLRKWNTSILLRLAIGLVLMFTALSTVTFFFPHQLSQNFSLIVIVGLFIRSSNARRYIRGPEK